MKTLKKVTLLLISIFLLTACNDDSLETQNDFTFDLDSETNTVYAKQDASYNFSLSELEVGTLYKVKVISDSNLSATLKINGNEVTIGDTIELSNNNLDITLTPNEVGATSFTIEVLKNEELKSHTIQLTSKMPTFDITVQRSFFITGGITANVTINLLDGYDQSLTYDYVGSSTGIVASPGPPRINLTGIIGNNTPSVQTLDLTGYMSGYTYKIQVTNEFGYTVTKNYTYQ